MTDSDVHQIISTERLHVAFLDRLTHYGIVYCLSVLPVMSLWFIVQDLLGYGPGIRTIFDFAVMGLIGLSLGTVAYVIQRKRLRFTTIPTDLPIGDVLDVIERTGVQLGWLLDERGSTFILARTRGGFFTGSWGERITIVFGKGRILVNSICDPDRPSSITALGRNTRNVSTLAENLKAKARPV